MAKNDKKKLHWICIAKNKQETTRKERIYYILKLYHSPNSQVMPNDRSGKSDNCGREIRQEKD